MIKSTELSEVRDSLVKAIGMLHPIRYVTRDEIGLLRVELTKALARVNAVERVVVGVPVPKSGDE